MENEGYKLLKNNCDVSSYPEIVFTTITSVIYVRGLLLTSGNLAKDYIPQNQCLLIHIPNKIGAQNGTKIFFSLFVVLAAFIKGMR